MAREQNKPEILNCARDGHTNCISRGPVRCRVMYTAFDRMVATVEEMETALHDLRIAYYPEGAHMDDVSLCFYMGACPVPLLRDSAALEAWRLYQAMKDGKPWPWRGGYYDQPHVYALAEQVIEDEMRKYAHTPVETGDRRGR